jgi:choline dehydrogenase-like flavoprotein
VSGYYAPVANRTNLHLITGQRVNEILFNAELEANGVRIQTRGLSGSDGVTLINAKKEIILAAGALHSPQVLQRSGMQLS